ncbi:MAG TPA: hypothetical protein VE863_13140, partial [Pyrinomonadaceae bacterium]|nr:hypothetical protein [Pyrinomonadaceae bacterium]
MSAEVLDLQLPGRSQRREAEENLSVLSDTESALSMICYRDPADVRMIRRQSWLIVLSFIIAGTAVIGVVYKSIQKPDRIVVDMSSGRAVMINDREFGTTE